MAKDIRSLSRYNESTEQTEIFYPATTTDAIADVDREQSLTETLEDTAFVGEVVGDPTGEWNKGEAEDYIDKEIAKVKNWVSNTPVTNVVTVSSLPASGNVNTLYRVAGTNTYSEYGWDGTQFVKLDEKEYGIDAEPTAGSNNLVKSGGVAEELALGAVYDVSAKNPTAGTNNDGKWESLSALLSNANLNTLIPTSVRKGGMSVKFVLTSSNMYVQYRYMGTAVTGTPNPFLDTTNWQGVDDVPTAGSKNLVKSGGVESAITNWPFVKSGSVSTANGTVKKLLNFLFQKGKTYKISLTLTNIVEQTAGTNINFVLRKSTNTGLYIFLNLYQDAVLYYTPDSTHDALYCNCYSGTCTASVEIAAEQVLQCEGLIDSNIASLSSTSSVSYTDNKIIDKNGNIINLNGHSVSDEVQGETILYCNLTSYGTSYANVVMYKGGELVSVMRLNAGYHTIYVPNGFSCRVASSTATKSCIKSLNKKTITEELVNINAKIASNVTAGNLSGLTDANIAEIKNPSPITYADETALLKKDGTVVTASWASAFRTSDSINGGKLVGAFLYQMDDAFTNFQLYKDGNVIKSYNLSEGYHFLYVPMSYTAKICTMTSKMSSAIIGNYNSSVSITEKLNQNIGRKPLEGLKVSWYGTSIPATGYPSIVGTMTGATVTNEAQGSSMARRGAKSTSYEDDPYKIKGLPWPVPVYGLMMSVAERNDVITNWLDYVDTWQGTYEGEQGAPTGAKPHDINDGQHEALKSTLRNLCYDVRVARHCGIDNEYNTGSVDVSDIYVIEHACNDVQYFFGDSSSDYNTIPADPYDKNVPIGALNALIKYIYENNPRAKVVLIGHYECQQTTGQRAKSVIETVANYWSIPLLKLYDLTGFSQVKIETNGYWDMDKVWHNTGFSFVVNGENWTSNNRALADSMVAGNNHGTISGSSVVGTNATNLMTALGITAGDGNAKWTPTRQEVYLNDNLHPQSDETKQYLARIIADWLCGIWGN